MVGGDGDVAVESFLLLFLSFLSSSSSPRPLLVSPSFLLRERERRERKEKGEKREKREREGVRIQSPRPSRRSPPHQGMHLCFNPSTSVVRETDARDVSSTYCYIGSPQGH